MLDQSTDCVSDLIEAFNSDMEEGAFLAELKKCRVKAPKAVSHLIRRIKKQEF